jgi:hypothetical protein
MGLRIVRAYGIYVRPPEFPSPVVVWGWSRQQNGSLVEERPVLVDTVDAARRAVERLLGPGARRVRCYDPTPLEVWGVLSVDPAPST